MNNYTECKQKYDDLDDEKEYPKILNIRVVEFFLMLAGYFFIKILLSCLNLLFMKVFIYNSLFSFVLGSLHAILELSIIGIYIYYKKAVDSSNRYKFIIDIWVYIIIISKIISIVIINNNITRQSLAVWSIIIGIIVCLISTSIYMKSMSLIIKTVIFTLLSLINFTLHDITFNIPKGMKVTTSIMGEYTYLIIAILCINIYYYLRKIIRNCNLSN